MRTLDILFGGGGGGGGGVGETRVLRRFVLHFLVLSFIFIHAC